MDKFELKLSDDPEISPENHTARFTFIVERDEPYNDDNRIWINWGVFKSPWDTNLDNVYGSKDSYEYDIDLTYSDYYDRIFINGIYWVLALTGMTTFWSALPFQLAFMVVLIIYVYIQPFTLWIFAPMSDNFTFDRFFFEIVLRW